MGMHSLKYNVIWSNLSLNNLNNFYQYAGRTHWRDKRFEFNQAEEECELDSSFPNYTSKHWVSKHKELPRYSLMFCVRLEAQQMMTPRANDVYCSCLTVLGGRQLM